MDDVISVLSDPVCHIAIIGRNMQAVSKTVNEDLHWRPSITHGTDPEAPHRGLKLRKQTQNIGQFKTVSTSGQIRRIDSGFTGLL